MLRHTLTFILGMVTGLGLTIAVAQVFLVPEPRLRFDINKDGGMSYGEFRTSIATIFQLIDVNDDQRLTKDEIDNVVNVGGRFLAEAITSWKWFQRFDKDRDDVLTRDEANQATVLSLWFKTNDRNGDRKLTVDELEDLPIAPVLIVR